MSPFIFFILNRWSLLCSIVVKYLEIDQFIPDIQHYNLHSWVYWFENFGYPWTDMPYEKRPNSNRITFFGTFNNHLTANFLYFLFLPLGHFIFGQYHKQYSFCPGNSSLKVSDCSALLLHTVESISTGNLGRFPMEFYTKQVLLRV